MQRFFFFSDSFLALLRVHSSNLRQLGLLALGMGLLGTPSLQAQDVVATGVIDYVSIPDGTVRLRSAQIGYRPLVFYGMNAANYVTESGRITTLADIAPGTCATLFFARHGRHWIISKVMVPDQEVSSWAPCNEVPQPAWNPEVCPPPIYSTGYRTWDSSAYYPSYPSWRRGSWHHRWSGGAVRRRIP